MAFGADNLRSIAGLFAIVFLCWIFSENRARFPWKLTLGAVLLQAGLVGLIFGLPGSQHVLQGLTSAVDGLAQATNKGTQFVFGFLAGGEQPYKVESQGALFTIAFQVLPLILVISALSAVLWHWRILRWLVHGFGVIFRKAMGLSGPSALAAASNIFLGMIESPILIKGYLQHLSRSEMFLMMTVGLATIAGSTMVAYAALLAPVLPNAAGHVLAASIISVPAAILLARVMIPERAGALGGEIAASSILGYESTMDALTRGISDGLAIVLNVAATLLVFVALVALVDAMLSAFADIAGAPITLERILGILLMPLAWIMGIPWSEAGEAGRLLGVKSVLTEFVGFVQLGALPQGAISERTRIMMTYALCGFANVGSVGIMISGLTVLMPARRAEVLDLGWKSLFPGFLATCMTASVVGAMPSGLFSH